VPLASRSRSANSATFLAVRVRPVAATRGRP
jgi:hypothetical protein